MVRKGCTLVEVLVAAAILAVLSGCWCALVTRGAAVNARAVEEQRAGRAARRIMHALLSTGFARLAATAGEPTALDPDALLVDGADLAGSYQVKPVESSLVAVIVTVRLENPGREPRSVVLRRLVMDPLVATAVRPPVAGSVL